MKRNLLLPIFISLFLISFVSAYNGASSIGDFLDELGWDNILLVVVFIVSFAVINFGAGRVFKNRSGEPNKVTAGVVALGLSLLITYGVNKSGFDISELVFNIGIPEDVLMWVIPLIILAGIIFLLFKIGFSWTIAGTGVFLIAASIMLDFYNKGIAILIGVILVIVGLFIKFKMGKKALGVAKGAGRAGKWINKRFQETGKKVDASLNLQREADERRERAQQAETEQRREREESKIAAKKRRDIAELEGKLRKHDLEVKKIIKNVKHIPARGTPEFRKWSQHNKAIKIILNQAKKRGVILKREPY